MCASQVSEARILAHSKSEPLRLRPMGNQSPSLRGVLMALTHCLEQQNIKKMADKRDILGDTLEEVKEDREVPHSGLTLLQALCQACCTQDFVDMSRHHEAGLWFK